MPVIQRWLDYLREMGIRYSHSVHPRAETALGTAYAERIPAHELAKTVVYFSDSGFGLAVVPADETVDLGKVARLLGLSRIRLANERELLELFPDCELGAMPPFGHSCELPVIMDPRISGEFLAFTIGTHQDVVRISFTDFQRLAKPKIAWIGVSEQVLASRPAGVSGAA